MKILIDEFKEHSQNTSYQSLMNNKIDEIVNWINDFEDAIENEQLKKENEQLKKENEQLKKEREWLTREIQLTNPQTHVGLSPDEICERMRQALK
ncbi:hypothetical protein LCGC14_2354500 [marine sediment metagenome]|uniref:Uncharacterized protein n=1 Tax=marine sediment metagenome TaxID=412755 RepID=A0A0F8W1M6_9ZZZZ